MRLFPHFKGPIRLGLTLLDSAKAVSSKHLCWGLYNGRNLESFRREHGETPVLLIVPPMSDREGALIHPGVEILQTILRSRGVACEVLNYGLPSANPRDPFDHLIRAVKTLGVKVLGVSLYSQAIERTMRGLQRLRAECPGVRIAVGGPHPTEAYLSLVGLSFIDYVVRGEAEQSFPELVERLLDGEDPAPGSIPGVYVYDRESGRVHGSPAAFVGLEEMDERGLLRYQLRPEEIRQYRLYGGAHGLVGPRYWPLAMVRGCPYACTYCAAYQMSGKRLRFRDVARVVDDIEFYLREYGQSRFSFVDDSFTEDYEYVVRFCQEILRRGLKVYWTTDNGIRYESLGAGKRLTQFLGKGEVSSTDDLLRLMIRAGWRGTSVGVESGSERVRTDLVRKGGARLDNQAIKKNLLNLKRVAREEGVYFYINAYLMIGFPEFHVRNGKIVPAETDAERDETYRFAMELRDCGALDFMHPSVVIPLPATEMWDHLHIGEKVDILISRLPEDHPDRERVEQIRASVVNGAAACELYQLGVAVGGRQPLTVSLDKTRYREEPEAHFWRLVYQLPDETQVYIHGAYDCFNADASYKIALKRPDGKLLWGFRQRMMEDFYGGLGMEFRLLKHVFRMCQSAWDVLSYMACLGRIYLPEMKERHAPLRHTGEAAAALSANWAARGQ